jgi:hypothetical protein
MSEASTPLKTSIAAAFATRPRPSVDRILRPEAEREGGQTRAFLATASRESLSPADIGAKIEGKLWMFGPESFRFFLPALLIAVLDSPELLGAFATELVEALTRPTRGDIEEMLDRLDKAPEQARLVPQVTASLQHQLLSWFDSGIPEAVFRDRFDEITPPEGAAILAFLTALRASGRPPPLERALDRAESRFWTGFGQSR